MKDALSRLIKALVDDVHPGDEAAEADKKKVSNRIGNYRILKKISDGDLGTTYAAEHVILGTPVCLKHMTKVTEDAEKRMIEEATKMWDLRHYGLPAVRDLFVADGSVALVTSYVPGYNLKEIIDKKKRLDSEHVAWISERVVNILRYMHYNGVIHGDLRPENIIVQPDKHMVVLVNYGFSRPAKKSEFYSPEQAAGDPLLPESDLYSLGVNMIYALGGDVKTKNVPSETPDSLCDLIRDFTQTEIPDRTSWEKEDICDRIREIRMKEYKRSSSGMMPIKGLEG